MTTDATPAALRFTDGLGPVGKKMTAEEYHRTDGKAGAFLWWSDIPSGAFLFTGEQVDALVAAERERILARCQGKTHEGCTYLARCGTVCNKCGQVA